MPASILEEVPGIVRNQEAPVMKLGTRIALQRLAGVVVAGLLLSGSSQCSFGGHDFGPGSSTTTAQMTIAPISAFGSVFAAATEFADGGATITLDGAPVGESLLRPGQVATVVGSVTSASSGTVTATATSVTVTDKLVGPVSAIDPATGSFTVLGQTVYVTGDTSVGPGFAIADVAGFPVGSVFVIDGYRTSSGLIATRIDAPRSGQTFQVAGRVSGLDGFVHSFSINGTTIDYGNASGGLPTLVTNGSYVVASGGVVTNATTLQPTLIDTATEAAGGGSGDNGVVHGAVTRFASSADFDVAGQAVATTTRTAFTHGALSDIAADRELEASGTYSSAGVLTATTIDVTPAATFRVVGPVQSLSQSAATLGIAGLTLTTDVRTRWDDQSLDVKAFGLGSLALGDWVEVRGLPGTGMAASARIVERRAQPSPAFVELQDVPTALSSPDFTLTGISIDARTASFTDAAGRALSQSSFFAQAAGHVVRVRGAFIGSTLTAATVALRP